MPQKKDENISGFSFLGTFKSIIPFFQHGKHIICTKTFCQAHKEQQKLLTKRIRYVYLEPKCPLFWLEKALFWRVDIQK